MRWILITAALLGASSVIIGASLQHVTSVADDTVAQTALRYHQLYSVVLLALGLYGLNQKQNKRLMCSALLFIAGIVIFCGSLYGVSALTMPQLGMLTPIGGVTLIIAWLSLAVLKRSTTLN